MNISVLNLSDPVLLEASIILFNTWQHVKADSHGVLLVAYVSSGNLFNTELCNILAIEIKLNLPLICL